MQGEAEQAHAAFKQEANIVLKLADTIGSDEQRTNFLVTSLLQRGLESP